MSAPFRPAEAFPPGEYIIDEMRERGWTLGELAERMGGRVDLNVAVLDFYITLPNQGLILDDETAAGLGRAFGTSADVWMNLDRFWRDWLASRPSTDGAG